MIIVEGCNGTGKSTFAKFLAKQFKLKYHKIPMTRDKAKKLSYKSYLEESQTALQNAVIDRFHWGNCVYPVVYKDGRERLTVWQQLSIERILLSRGAIIIYCYASDNFVENIYKTRGEEWQTFDDYKIEKQEFKKTFETSILPRYEYSPEMTSLQVKNLIRDIKNDYNKRQRQFKKMKHFKGNGDIMPKPIMLVGEKLGPNEKLFKHAFAGHGGSSDYLHETLAITDYSKSYYLTNAIKTNDESKNMQLINQEIQLLKPLGIVALGNIAHQLLRKSTIIHRTVPHPQYVKRFLFGAKEQYAELINVAVQKCMEDIQYVEF